jgi:cytochrome c heme-lyase
VRGLLLSTDRLAGGTWVYPSEQMFFNAMRRKGWSPREEDMARCALAGERAPSPADRRLAAWWPSTTP